jgi:hypothetical protein
MSSEDFQGLLAQINKVKLEKEIALQLVYIIAIWDCSPA